MKLSDLNPGDVFRYLDGRREFLSGLFMKMHQNNTYISPMTEKHCNFIISLNDGMSHNHADRREVEIILKYKERTMENKMNHFIGWKFGVPVKIFNIRGVQVNGFTYLINETKSYFTTISKSGNVEGSAIVYGKTDYYYELIPHKYNYGGGVNKPRYPICESPKYMAFCNSLGDMTRLDVLSVKTHKFAPIFTATLIIDGKTIELSAETTAELKKKLGV